MYTGHRALPWCRVSGDRKTLSKKPRQKNKKTCGLGPLFKRTPIIGVSWKSAELSHSFPTAWKQGKYNMSFL